MRVLRSTRTTAATSGSHSVSSSADPGKVDRNATVLLAISREIATVVDGDWRGCCGDVFEATQQARLIILDLHDQVIAGVAGDLEGFFGSAWRRA